MWSETIEIFDPYHAILGKAGVLTMSELKACRCGAMPIQETQVHMLGRIEDGGYPVTIGRHKCPECGNAPSWGQSYSIHYGWDENIGVWNRCVGCESADEYTVSNRPKDGSWRVGEGEKG